MAQIKKPFNLLLGNFIPLFLIRTYLQICCNTLFCKLRQYFTLLDIFAIDYPVGSKQVVNFAFRNLSFTRTSVNARGG